MRNPKTHIQPDISTEVLSEEDYGYTIIIYNDDVNTFDWVIECLIEICHHTYEQAEQCALFIHFKGKYAVKRGEKSDLKPQTEALCERGLNAVLVQL